MTIMLRPGKEARILAGIIVALVVAIFALFNANSTLAAGSMQTGQKDTVQGEIVAVDNLHHMRMLTVRSEKIGNFPNDRLNIFLSRNAKVNICNEREPSKDISVSKNAVIIYHEVRGWLPVADAISEQC